MKTENLRKLYGRYLQDVNMITITLLCFLQQGWTNLPLRARFFGRAIVFKNGRAKSKSMCTSEREQLEIVIFVLCYLNSACSLHF